RPRLRFARTRPQQKGHSLPRLRRIAMQNQVCDQRVETVGVDGGDRLSRAGDPQVAEQVDLHQRVPKQYSADTVRTYRRPSATAGVAKSSSSSLLAASTSCCPPA